MEEIKNQPKQKNYKLRRALYVIISIVVDIALCVLAYWIARTITFFDPFFEKAWKLFEPFNLLALSVSVVVTVISLACFDCYSAIWKYASRVELMKIICAYVVVFVVVNIFKYAMVLVGEIIPLFNEFKYWESHILLYIFFALVFTLAWRFFFSILHYIKHLWGKNAKRVKITRTLVIGAGFAGSLAVAKFVNHPEDGYVPLAILDDDPEKQGHKIYGVKVVGAISDVAKAVKNYAPDIIVIAINAITKSQLRHIHDMCSQTGVPVKIIPNISNAEEYSQSNLSFQDIRIEDLLGREQFKVKQELMDVSVKDKVVCVTGGAGSIGSELCRQALNFGCKHLIIFDYHENGMFFLNQEFVKKYDTSRYTLVIGTVREKEKLLEAFRKYKPEIVFHAAAYKHVPMMEIAPTEAIKTNLFGTKNVIDCAEETGVEKFVLISTDKAVNPSSVMGASKRITEMLIQMRGRKSKMKMAAVRFGNVLGSNGSVVPIFLQQIKEGGPITLTDRNIKRYFMSIPEAVKLVLQTGAFADSGEVFVLDMGEPVYIYDLACSLIRLSGLIPEEDIKIEITGLRPGEKLFEELRYDKELVDTTAHEGVFVNKLQDIDEDEFNKILAEFKVLTDNEDEDGTEKKIFEVVPNEYRH
ncbi:MAG: polysaccharide biosynthesis protein [Clostridia bacterium]|nr:polysaccharide biosynthesis protein [Clostridia bacterium]